MRLLIAIAAPFFFASLTACEAESAGDQIRAEKTIELCLSRFEHPNHLIEIERFNDQMEELAARSLVLADVPQIAKLSLPGEILKISGSASQDLFDVFFSRPVKDQATAWTDLLQGQRDGTASSIKRASSRSNLNGLFIEDVSPPYVWLSTDRSMLLSVDSGSLSRFGSCSFAGVPKETAMVGLGEIADHMTQDNRSYADGLIYEGKGPLSNFTVRFLKFNRSFPQGEPGPVTVLTIRSNL